MKGTAVCEKNLSPNAPLCSETGGLFPREAMSYCT